MQCIGGRSGRKPRVPAAHTYSCGRYATWLRLLYEIMLEGFLCLTKPSKRAVRGAVSPHPCVHAGVFLCSLGIISTVSKPLRYALPQEYVCAAGTRGLRPLRCGRYALTCAPSLRSAYVPYAVAEMLFKSVQSTRQIP